MTYKLGVAARSFSPEHKAQSSILQAVRSAFSTQAAATAYVEGVDVSTWQGYIDWEIMAEKAAFVIIRAGYGNNYIDPRLDFNVSSAAALGVPYGLYWYVKPGKDAAKHAQTFAGLVADYGSKIEPTFDLEETGGLDKNALYNWYAKLYNKFQEYSGLQLDQIMTYTSAGFLDRSIPLTNFLKWSKLWVAHWTTASQPIIPQEWAKSGKTWTYWQYSAKGDGIAYGAQSKSIDLNRKNEAAPEPEPPPGGEVVIPKKIVELLTTLNPREKAAGAQDFGRIAQGSVVPITETETVNGKEWGKVEAWIQLSDYTKTVG